MTPLNIDDVREFIENNISNFHDNRLISLKNLKLENILKRKNPYLFKAKNILTAQDLVKNLLDSYLSAKEETIFGELLERLALFINEKVYGGRKSSAEGIDLEFEKDGIKYIVSVKSGPNWGNSSQVKKMKENFRKAKKILGSNTSKINIIAINGCCYGRLNKYEKEEYQKLCGQRFWTFISGNENLYTDLIEPFGYMAKEKNEDFNISYAQIINKFTLEFGNDFCDDGIINWKKLIEFNSSINEPEKKIKKIKIIKTK